MYTTLLAIHGIIRWLVLGSLVFGIFSCTEGLVTKRKYSGIDTVTRGLVSGLSHVQLIVGLLLYVSISPITKSFLQNGAQGNDQILFFGVWHAAVMVIAVILITIGAALAKRASTDQKKFRTSLTWFSIALVLILGAIPWFRPFFRLF